MKNAKTGDIVLLVHKKEDSRPFSLSVKWVVLGEMEKSLSQSTGVNWFVTYDCTSDGTVIDKDWRRQLATVSQMFPLNEVDEACRFAKRVEQKRYDASEYMRGYKEGYAAGMDNAFTTRDVMDIAADNNTAADSNAAVDDNAAVDNNAAVDDNAACDKTGGTHQFDTREKVEELRAKYPVGTRVVLDKMDDPQSPPAGTSGTVRFVDDMASIHMAWETGSALALIPGVDEFHAL